MIRTMFTDLPDLAAERLGSAVVEANDEFFAAKEGLIRATAPVWREGEYTDRGKWMDGWETRRRRTPGHDWATIRLGAPGIVRGVVIDTAFFTGNFPESASVDGCADGVGHPGSEWFPLLPNVRLVGNAANAFAIDTATRRVTHVRLNIFPDGGVARLRVHGEVVPDLVERKEQLDLAALLNGAVLIDCSDMHYGNPQNLILPGASTHMGDGWETRRRRGPGHDWAIIRLAHRGVIQRVELDTDHYKGNAPGRSMIEACDAAEGFDAATATWRELVPESPLEPNARHRWEPVESQVATHVRLNIYPDGGVARLRLFGTLARDKSSDA